MCTPFRCLRVSHTNTPVPTVAAARSGESGEGEEIRGGAGADMGWDMVRSCGESTKRAGRDLGGQGVWAFRGSTFLGFAGDRAALADRAPGQLARGLLRPQTHILRRRCRWQGRRRFLVRPSLACVRWEGGRSREGLKA
jgi:hypothetical protein